MIDIKGVQPGDRVRLTASNGDEATFTVTYTGPRYLESERHAFEAEEWDTLEILEKAGPKLPTEPGFYRPKNAVLGGWAFHLDIKGNWKVVWGDGYVEAITPDDGHLVRLVPEQQS